MNKPCFCEVCVNSPKRVGYKKYRKWNAAYISRVKKQLKRLRDSGIRKGSLVSEIRDAVSYAVLTAELCSAEILYTEARLKKKNKGKDVCQNR